MAGIITSFLVRYNERSFWKMYMACQNGDAKGIRRIYYVYRIKRISSLHCCDFMVTLNGDRSFGAYFASPPYLPHRLNGIVISDQAYIGKNAIILQQVTIGVKHLGGKAPHIGENVFIGAGAKVLGDITIGNNVVIGANAVVVKDVPDNAVVAGNPAVILRIKESR